MEKVDSFFSGEYAKQFNNTYNYRILLLIIHTLMAAIFAKIGIDILQKGKFVLENKILAVVLIIVAVGMLIYHIQSFNVRVAAINSAKKSSLNEPLLGETPAGY